MDANPFVRHTLGVSLVVLAAAAIYMSWGALYEFAIACGIPPERAVVFPAVIDVVTVVSMLVALLIEPGTKRAEVYPWASLILFGAATIAGNAMHVVTIPAGLVTVPVWVAVIANAMPAIALLVTTHLAAVTVYRRKPAKPVTTPQADRDARRPAVLTLASEGKSIRDITRETGVARSTVARWVRTGIETA